ncbi:MAG: hypothetical protein JWO06_642 [Bacteroidota bacterium]|nr:hypothetical protein [Bacteroidota bacterium]
MANWTRKEDELIIADYVQMLSAELKGSPYNKTKHRDSLLTHLKGRTPGAIEYKHRNISAVLIKYGKPYLQGYKPLPNYQLLLEEEVLEILNKQKGIEKAFEHFALNEAIGKPGSIDFAKWEVTPPAPYHEKKTSVRTFSPVKRNYLEIEQKNRSIGKIGEQLVYDYEIWRLRKAELPRLANTVKWVSKEQGDGAGFDILSKNENGKDIFIEVKSTSLGKESPFFFSETENEFSEINSKSFFLYRVFDVRDEPKIFIKNGKLHDICSFVRATNFRGFV